MKTPRLRLGVLLLIILGAIMAAFALLRIHIRQSEMEEALESNAKHVAQRIARAVRPTIWNLAQHADPNSDFYETTQAILDSELADPEVKAIYVYGVFGHFFMGKRKSEDGSLHTYQPEHGQPTPKKGERYFSHPIRKGEMTIGDVKVVLSSAHLEASRHDLLRVEIIQALVLIIVCVSFLSFSINRSLIKPMGEVIYLKSLSEKHQALFHSIHKSLATEIGEHFLEHLVRTLTETLKVDGAVIGQLHDLHGGILQFPASYFSVSVQLPDQLKLESTLLEPIVYEGSAHGNSSWDHLFGPNVKTDLATPCYYFGVPVKDPKSNAIGVLLVVSQSHMDDLALTLSVLEVFAARAGAELSRIRLNRENQDLEVQLHHAQRMETLGTLAGGIAHDFNNLLLPMGGYAEMALHQLEPDTKLHKDIKAIQSAVKRASDLVRQIQTFSRTTPLAKEIFHVEALLEETVRFAKGTLPPGKSVQLDIRGKLPPILASKTQIDQCLVNLITNASHAIEQTGFIKIHATSRRISEDESDKKVGLKPGPHVVIEIIDNGCGMDSATMSHIFEPFFTTKPTGKGTGLGLATLHSIITGHGGMVEVESEMGKGSTFRLLLPASDKKVHEPDPVQERERHEIRGLRVLFIDDEKRNVELGIRMLESLGCHVEAFNDPKEGLQAFQKGPLSFDVLVTDFAMPDMTGQELILEILKIRHDLPCMIATGYQVLTPEQWRNLGVFCVMDKPYDRDQLALALSNLPNHPQQ